MFAGDFLRVADQFSDISVSYFNWPGWMLRPWPRAK
jgi:hypothetical protein